MESPNVVVEQILFERESLCGNNQKGGKKKQEAKRDSENQLGGDYIIWSSSDQANAERLIDKAGTLNCNRGQRGGWICKVTETETTYSPEISPCLETTCNNYSRADGFVCIVCKKKSGNGVRRLTPVECERLQGFPDNWTSFGINENGKEIKQSDESRYKQLGNAVTVNVTEWIANRLVNAVKENP